MEKKTKLSIKKLDNYKDKNVIRASFKKHFRLRLYQSSKKDLTGEKWVLHIY